MTLIYSFLTLTVTHGEQSNVFRTGLIIEPEKLPIHGSLVRPVVEPMMS